MEPQVSDLGLRRGRREARNRSLHIPSGSRCAGARRAPRGRGRLDVVMGASGNRSQVGCARPPPQPCPIRAWTDPLRSPATTAALTGGP